MCTHGVLLLTAKINIVHENPLLELQFAIFQTRNVCTTNVEATLGRG